MIGEVGTVELILIYVFSLAIFFFFWLRRDKLKKSFRITYVVFIIALLTQISQKVSPIMNHGKIFLGMGLIIGYCAVLGLILYFVFWIFGLPFRRSKGEDNTQKK